MRSCAPGGFMTGTTRVIGQSDRDERGRSAVADRVGVAVAEPGGAAEARTCSAADVGSVPELRSPGRIPVALSLVRTTVPWVHAFS